MSERSYYESVSEYRDDKKLNNKQVLISGLLYLSGVGLYFALGAIIAKLDMINVATINAIYAFSVGCVIFWALCLLPSYTDKAVSLKEKRAAYRLAAEDYFKAVAEREEELTAAKKDLSSH